LARCGGTSILLDEEAPSDDMRPILHEAEAEAGRPRISLQENENLRVELDVKTPRACVAKLQTILKVRKRRAETLRSTRITALLDKERPMKEVRVWKQSMFASI
jgi:hypothetical protein